MSLSFLDDTVSILCSGIDFSGDYFTSFFCFFNFGSIISLMMSSSVSITSGPSYSLVVIGILLGLSLIFFFSSPFCLTTSPLTANSPLSSLFVFSINVLTIYSLLGSASSFSSPLSESKSPSSGNSFLDYSYYCLIYWMMSTKYTVCGIGLSYSWLSMAIIFFFLTMMFYSTLIMMPFLFNLWSLLSAMND